MHGRLALALLALSLLLPASANAAVDPGKDIRKVEGYTASAGALVRVTLREKLSGRIGVSFRTRGGVKGSARPSATIRRGRRVDFLFRGDARNLGRAIVRTGPRGERASRRLPATSPTTAPRSPGSPASCARCAAAAPRCGPACAPSPAARAPAAARRSRSSSPARPRRRPARFTPPAARFSLADGLTPEDPLGATAAITFADASQGTELVDWRLGLRRRRRRDRPRRPARVRPARPLHRPAHQSGTPAGSRARSAQEVFVRGPAAPRRSTGSSSTAPPRARRRP